MTNQNLFTAQDASGNLIYVDVPPSPAGLHYILNGGVGGTEIAVTTTATATIGRIHRCTGTSGNYALTLPAVAGCAGQYLEIIIDAAMTRLVTVTGNAAETIDGSNTRVMHHGEKCTLRGNDAGTAWEKVAGISIPMIARISASGTQTIGNGGGLIAGASLNTSDIDNTGLMVSTTNHNLVIQRTGYWIISTFVQWNIITAVTRLQSEVIINGGEYTLWEGAFPTTGTYPNICAALPQQYITAGYAVSLSFRNNSAGNETLWSGIQLAATEVLIW